MELKDDLELAVTREKLKSLEARYEAVRRDPAALQRAAVVERSPRQRVRRHRGGAAGI